MTIEELEFALTETVSGVVYPERVGPLMHSIMLTVEDWGEQVSQGAYDDGHRDGMVEVESDLPDIDDIKKEAREEGYEEGFREGRVEGYDDGYIDGNDS